MTRKDYELIAQAINAEYSRKGLRLAAVVAILDVARSLADALHKDNPRFAREKFVRACTKYEVNQ